MHRLPAKSCQFFFCCYNFNLFFSYFSDYPWTNLLISSS